MKAEDIRRLYREVEAASDEDAQATQDEVRSSPDAARKLFAVICALSSQDREFGILLNRVCSAALVDLLTERLATDDAYAVRMGQLIISVKNTLMPAAKVKRGKQARTA